MPRRNRPQTIGKAVVNFWERAEAGRRSGGDQLAIEAAANVIHEGVQNKLLHYSIKGPEALRSIASSSLSDPRAVLLPTSPEFVGPLVERIHTATLRPRKDGGRFRAARCGSFRRPAGTCRLPKAASGSSSTCSFPSSTIRRATTQWFLAEQLGRVLAANPDFRTETLLVAGAHVVQQPAGRNVLAAQRRLDADLRRAAARSRAIGRCRPTASELQRFALDLYVRNLDPQEPIAACGPLPSRCSISRPSIPAPKWSAAASRIDAGNFRRLLPEAFERELAASRRGRQGRAQAGADARAAPQFRLLPRLCGSRAGPREPRRRRLVLLLPRRRKGSVHVARGADRRTRFLSPRDTWTNYRTLLERIEVSDVEQSKLLRKPLNIQTGKEDGHQGGMRYKPGDRGYEILRRWVLDAAKLK